MNFTHLLQKHDLPVDLIETVTNSVDIMGGTSHFSGGLCLRWNRNTKSIFSIKCQSDFKTEKLVIPADLEFWTINGGPLTTPSDECYRNARIATFMGRRIIQTFAPQALENKSGEQYLTNLSADVWRAIRDLVPESISGAEFIDIYGDLNSIDIVVDPNQTYQLRLATEHPIYENERTNKFVRFLELAHLNPNARKSFLIAAGELMIQNHFSYDHRYDLGNKESDLIVKLARDTGKQTGIYGAKLSGDGDSTTVALLCDRIQNSDIEAAIQTIAEKYEEETGYNPQITSGK
jgi:galactokinase